MAERLIKIAEIAVALDVNQFTIERWYKFKRENPEDEYAKMLPDFVYLKNSKNRPIRYWKESDLYALQKFQECIGKGTKGILGQLNTKERKNGKKKVNRNGSTSSKRQQK